jgi:type IV pilus biogenesis protein PilP
MQGSSQQNAAYAATMGGNAPMPMNATNSSPGQQPITGIAPPLTGNELDSELNSQAGPPLPDAQLTGHRADASLEMDLKNRSALLDLQTSVNDKLLGVMKQDEELRIAYARTQMPITVFPTIDSDGATAEQALTNSQNSGSSTASSGTAGTAGATVPTAPDTGTTTTAPTPVPVPVVYAIGGIGSNLTADILIPYSGAREVTVGSNLPNGLKVVKIDPFSVLVRSSDGNIYSLPMGRSVPSTPPAPPQAPTAIQQDMSPVTFQAPAPPTVGGTAPANGSGWSQ